jgi:hypothetical protein
MFAMLVGLAGAAMGLTPDQCNEVYSLMQTKPIPVAAGEAAQEFLIAVLQVKGI